MSQETKPEEMVSEETVAEQAKKIARLESELEKAQIEIEKITTEANNNLELARRCKADEENTKRRASVDIENAHKYALNRFAESLLQVADSLQRGLEITAKENKNIDVLREGMELTNKLLMDTFDKYGIKLLNPLGEKFDPKVHEALSMQPTSECDPETIITVVQSGYMLHERVLRPARVIVARAEDNNNSKIDTNA